MSFGWFFVLVVLFAMCAPEQFALLGSRMFAALAPIIEKGFILVIMVFGILKMLGK